MENSINFANWIWKEMRGALLIDAEKDNTWYYQLELLTTEELYQKYLSNIKTHDSIS